MSGRKKPETLIVNDIQEWVINYGGKVLKTHGDAMGEIGTPDLIGSIIVKLDSMYYHIPFAVEVKLPGEQPTTVQEIQLKRWNRAGMSTAIVRSLDEFVIFIREAASWAAYTVYATPVSGQRYFEADYISEEG